MQYKIEIKTGNLPVAKYSRSAANVLLRNAKPKQFKIDNQGLGSLLFDEELEICIAKDILAKVGKPCWPRSSSGIMFSSDPRTRTTYQAVTWNGVCYFGTVKW